MGPVSTHAEAPARSRVTRPGRRTAGDRLRLLIQVLGELLITFGIVVLLFAVYELKVTDIRAASTQRGLEADLNRAWAGPPPTTQRVADPAVAPEVGQPFAVLRVPRLGEDYSRVVVEGVGHEDLKKGPGHYPRTALPGQVGNAVLSGHRTTYGAPFSNVDHLAPGDAIDIQVSFRTYHYRVTGSRIVNPDQSSVLLPVPDQPGVRPTARLLTVTTCNPRFSAAQRLIVVAEMKPGDYTDTS